jgi:hypothetical protein
LIHFGKSTESGVIGQYNSSLGLLVVALAEGAGQGGGQLGDLRAAARAGGRTTENLPFSGRELGELGELAELVEDSTVSERRGRSSRW